MEGYQIGRVCIEASIGKQFVSDLSDRKECRSSRSRQGNVHEKMFIVELEVWMMVSLDHLRFAFSEIHDGNDDRMLQLTHRGFLSEERNSSISQLFCAIFRAECRLQKSMNSPQLVRGAGLLEKMDVPFSMNVCFIDSALTSAASARAIIPPTDVPASRSKHRAMGLPISSSILASNDMVYRPKNPPPLSDRI